MLLLPLQYGCPGSGSMRGQNFVCKLVFWCNATTPSALSGSVMQVQGGCIHMRPGGSNGLCPPNPFPAVTYDELACGYFRAAMAMSLWMANHAFFLDAIFSVMVTGAGASCPVLLVHSLWGRASPSLRIDGCWSERLAKGTEGLAAGPGLPPQPLILPACLVAVLFLCA
jgi:hypothetical protein